jgi:hypothetical protein
MIPRPLVERELAGLLLSLEQVNVAMETTGMTVTDTQTVLSDNSATMAPQECLALDGAGEAGVYGNSGYRAERDQSLNDGDNFAHYLKQAVMLFPTVDASAQQWAAGREIDRAAALAATYVWSRGAFVRTVAGGAVWAAVLLLSSVRSPGRPGRGLSSTRSWAPRL